MSAMFWARFDNGELVTVYSADAKSMKPKHLRESTRGAIKKAKAKLAKRGIKAKLIDCRCVG